MELREQIASIAREYLTDEHHFIVDVVISSSGGPKKVLILLDGDEGVTIDDCADLSRAVGHELEEKDIIGDAYRLEVSSPGVDYPLQMIRQYQKNIGRQVKVTLQEGRDVKGVLKSATDEGIVLDKEMKKGKKTEHEEVEIPMRDINKTIVQISFK